jgi:Pyruvate/2-oxoacid:ferredoxin oxidoreductase delta subunit
MVKEKMIPSVDYKLCMACCVCISSCPFSCLDSVKTGLDSYNKAYPELVSIDTCTGCRICAIACPVDVITMVSR